MASRTSNFTVNTDYRHGSYCEGIYSFTANRSRANNQTVNISVSISAALRGNSQGRVSFGAIVWDNTFGNPGANFSNSSTGAGAGSGHTVYASANANVTENSGGTSWGWPTLSTNIYVWGSSYEWTQNDHGTSITIPPYIVTTLNDPIINEKKSTSIKYTVSWNTSTTAYGFSRIDSRLQLASSPYGQDVISGWQGDGDHRTRTVSGLTANTKYQIHSYVANNNNDDYASNGNKEGGTVKTYDVWTLPIAGTASPTVKKVSGTQIQVVATGGGSWTTTNKSFQYRYSSDNGATWINSGESTASTNNSYAFANLTVASNKNYLIQTRGIAVGGGRR